MRRHRLVRVPASSANLGPGYDCLAAALSLNLELEVEETGEFFVHTDVPGVPADRSNLCVRAFEALHPADGLTFHIRSEIPVGAGLGSSAAAIVAGLVAADHLYELDAPILELARELEGHPDNVAAALRGGFVICTERRRGPVRPAAGDRGRDRHPARPGADRGGAGGAAGRGADGGRRPQRRATRRCSCWASSGTTSTWSARGLEDRLHQPRREHLYPRSMELVRNAQELGAVARRSRAPGPTVLFWIHWQQTGAVMDAVRQAAPDCDVRRVQFIPHGADVKEL